MIQLLTVEGLEVGILLSKAEDDDGSPDATTHWVVSVEGPQDEEIISEKALGRILGADDSDGSTIEKSTRNPTKKTTKVKAKLNEPKKVKRKTKTRAKRKGKSESDVDEMQNEVIKAPPPKPKKKQGDESVVEIRMLTGTLLMYRGTANRRVEFVRTI